MRRQTSSSILSTQEKCIRVSQRQHGNNAIQAFKAQALEAFYTTQTKPMGSKQFACLRQYTHKHTNYVVLEQLICHNSFKWLRESKPVWMGRRYILACWVIPLSNICKRILYCSRASPSLQTNTDFLIWTIMKYNSKEHNTASSFKIETHMSLITREETYREETRDQSWNVTEK